MQQEDFASDVRQTKLQDTELPGGTNLDSNFKLSTHRIIADAYGCTNREDAEELFQEIREDEAKVREGVNQSIL